jgi:hypothetical protein
MATERYCPTCGVDCWALAAGSDPAWSSLTAPVAGTRSTDASSSFRAALAGRRLRLGVGVALAAALAVNALAGIASDADDGSPGGRAGTADGGPSGQVLGDVGVPPVTPVGGASTDAGRTSIAPPADPTDSPASSVDPVPDPAATAAPLPVSTSVPAPTATPPPAPIVIEGSGTLVTDAFAYPGGLVRVHSRAIAASGGCVYIGTFSSTDASNLPADPSLRTAVIYLEDAGQGEGWVDLDLPAGSYFMDIESDCAWTVTIGRA